MIENYLNKITFFDNVSKEHLFIYIVISLIFLFIFTTVIDIQPAHFMALIVSSILIVLLIQNNSNDITDDLTSLEIKLLSLSESSDPGVDLYEPDNFHLDADYITFFYSIKQDFYKYNPKTYNNALKNVDVILKIISDLSEEICEENEIDHKKCNKTLPNSYELFKIASDKSKLVMNYLHSFIYTIPNDPFIRLKFQKILERGQLLLNRSLDTIKSIHLRSIRTDGINKNTRFITDYNLPQPYSAPNSVFERY